MTKNSVKSFHSGTVKKNIKINVPKLQGWKEISNLVGLPCWLVDAKKTVFLSRKKRGIGAIRKITFGDGNTMEEHVVAWKNGDCFTYIATDGLPLRAYVATLSVKAKSKNVVSVTWQTYLNSNKMSKRQFEDFKISLGQFYVASLKNLKKKLENKAIKV